MSNYHPEVTCTTFDARLNPILFESGLELAENYHYNLGLFRAAAAQKGKVILFAAAMDESETMIGFGLTTPIDHLPFTWEIDGVYVRPDRRRQRVGTVIVKQLCDSAKNICASEIHATTNPYSKELFMRLGFKKRDGGTDSLFREL